MLLYYNNITIRNATPKDGELLCQWWNNGELMVDVGFPKGLGTTAEKISTDLATDSDDTRRRLIVELDGRPMGEMAYENLGNNTASMDIKICDLSLQNRGYGKILMSLVIAWLFDQGYREILLKVDGDNKRAQHVYEQLGFVPVATHKDSWKDQLGNLRWEIDYRLTQENFNNYAK